MVLAAFCGLRSGELRGLKWSDVGTLSVRRAADRWNQLGPTKTTAARRVVPLIGLARQALREQWLACSKAGDLNLAFLTARPAGWMDHSIVRDTLARAQKAAGIVDREGRAKFSPHDFRHHCASAWIVHPGHAGGESGTNAGRRWVCVTGGFPGFQGVLPMPRKLREGSAASRRRGAPLSTCRSAAGGDRGLLGGPSRR